MKFLTKPRKYLEVVVFLVSYLAFLAVYTGILPQYLFWHALPRTPEPIEKVYFVFFDEITVTITSNKRFTCDVYDMEGCWMEDRSREEWLPFTCGEIWHNEQSIQFSQPCYFIGGSRGHSTSFSLNDDGLIYARQKASIAPLSYLLGVVFAAFCAFIFFLGRVSLSSIIHRLQKVDRLVGGHLLSKD